MVEIALKGDFPLESTLTLGPSAVVQSLWLVAEGEASLNFAPRGGRRLNEDGLAAPLIETAPGAPPLFLDGVRLHGPVRIDGSRASLRNCTIEDVNEGTALMATNRATVVLSDGTLLRNNAKSLEVDDSSSVHYQLPAPLGRYINAPNGFEQELTSVEGDFPFACAPGVSGASDDRSAQNGPQCSGLCPAGKMCPGATAEPEPCSAGGYCAEGSPTAVPCEPGTYIDDEGAKSKSACAPCPTGAWCAAGQAFMRAGLLQRAAEPGRSGRVRALPRSAVDHRRQRQFVRGRVRLQGGLLRNPNHEQCHDVDDPMRDLHGVHGLYGVRHDARGPPAT